MKPILAILPALLLAPLAGLHGAATKPNIILILADDMGYGDPGCYGGKLAPMPAIDSLARDGVRCTDGYVTAPVCAPSRCGLMTGAYNQRFGMQWNEDQFRTRGYSVPASHKLLPQALKAAVYVTGHIGKWNIGADIAGRWFADCTGDAAIGALAGADFEMQPKGRMGPCNLWNVCECKDTNALNTLVESAAGPVAFPRCPWALDL